MSKFDRLPESDSDEEDDEVDPEEEARQRAALKRAQPAMAKKLFKGLSSAIADGPPADGAPVPAPGGALSSFVVPLIYRVHRLRCSFVCALIDCDSYYAAAASTRATETCTAYPFSSFQAFVIQ